MIGLTAPKLNQLVWKVFTKGHGLTLQGDAAEYLIECLSRNGDDLESIKSAAEYIAQVYSKQEGRSNIVDMASLEGVVSGIFKSKSGGNGLDYDQVDVRLYTHLVQAVDVAAWEYQPHSKQFVLQYLKKCKCATDHLFNRKRRDSGLLGEPKDKIDMNIARYESIKQRLLRHPKFQGSSNPAAFISADSEPVIQLKLSTIKSVKCQAFKDPKCLFGMLIETVEGQWFLEDPEDNIKLIMSKETLQVIKPGYYTEGSFVVVLGLPRTDAFEVHEISMPPMESLSITKSLLVVPDATCLAVKEVEGKDILLRRQNCQVNIQFLFFADLWLDNPTVMQRFDEILAHHCQPESPIPPVIVLMGRFLTVVPPEGSRSLRAYQEGFDKLARIIARHGDLVAGTRFIFIPGPEDNLYPNILPRAPLPLDLFDSFTELGIDFQLGSNPCRLVYFTREIVIFRNEVTAVLQRSQIPELKSDNHRHQMFVHQTLLDQGHLSPMSLSIQARQWNMEHSLRLYPVPDMLCVAEANRTVNEDMKGVRCINPGSFFREGFSYAIYSPTTNTAIIRQHLS